MLLPPTSCRHVMLARRRECGPKAEEVAAFGGSSLVEFLPDPGAPHRLLAVIILWKHPRIGAAVLKTGNPDPIAFSQGTERQWPPALGGFRLVDITAPVALLDPEAAQVQIDVLDHEAGHLGYAGAGVHAGLVDEAMRVFQPRQHSLRLVFVQNALLADLPLLRELHAVHRACERVRQDLPLLGLRENAIHDVPQVGHHVPGFALVLEPIENLLGPEFGQARTPQRGRM